MILIKKLCFACVILLASCSTFLIAIPQPTEVVQGDVSFQQDGLKTTIEASHNSIINYDSFNIAQQEIVQFVQPDQQSRVLNRIHSAMPSQLDGTLQANGIVYIVNPAGVIFGKDSVIDVGSLCAAAANISDHDFVNHMDRFEEISGDICNNGLLIANNTITLIAKQVKNYGQMIADKDVVVFTADGHDLLLGERDGHIFFSISERELDHSITQEADGGIMSGDMVSLGVDSFVSQCRNEGIIEARDVTLYAYDGHNYVSGGIDCCNKGEYYTGGTVKVLGEVITVNEAIVDVSGDMGAGKIFVGGDSRGAGYLPLAEITTVDTDTFLLANAIYEGNGGTIVVWSNRLAVFDGLIESCGGKIRGNGGRVETIGDQDMFMQFGVADVTAPKGKDGIWFANPNSVPKTNTSHTIAHTVDSVTHTKASSTTQDPATVIDDSLYESSQKIIREDNFSLYLNNT